MGQEPNLWNLVVDVMHKANYASRICHLCRPNCEAKVTAIEGQYQIGIYTVHQIQYGEEITFDYNSVTESKEEYEVSVCLCGSQVCRMSYLNLIGEGIFQKVLKGCHGILDRYQLMLEAVEVAGECLETHEPMTIQSLMLNEISNVHDGMEISDGIGTSSEQVERMPELVTLSTGLHDDQQCPGSLEMFANLHSSPIEPRNSDISSRMDDESNNSGMLATTNIRPGRDSWRNLEVEDGELPQVQNGTLQQNSSVDAKLIKEGAISSVDNERRQALQTTQVVMNMFDATMPGTLNRRT